MITYDSIVNKSLANAKEISNRIFARMMEYWTPFEGHKVSPRSSIEKWNDFLKIAQSGRRTAMSEEEELIYFRLECAVYAQLKDWNP